MRASRLLFWIVALSVVANGPRTAPAADIPPQGVSPTDENGRLLNLDFETGTLRDWTAAGDAFVGQPVEDDVVARRRTDMKSAHAGKFWVGGYERVGDKAQGTLTSRPFRVTHPWARFLVAGGPHPETRVEIVRQDTGAVVLSASGDETEELKPVAVDLTALQGKLVFIRLVDQHSGGWGHLNFDDFKFFAARPPVSTRSVPTAPDAFAHEGLPPQKAAEAMTVPEGFKVTLFAGEPDVVQPIAFALDDRGRLWVAEAYSYPRRVPDDQARDRILIFEDSDGDGRFDKKSVFTDKLNLVSGLELGFGGVWVGAAPNLLFIPDANHDDKPDGPPQVVLDGWGYQDTHETLNSFTWGPDGWLYGCHGVFTHSQVGKPGTPEGQRTPINAGIWRYHPTKRTFEVFAHGTSNPWGVDFDEHGQAFLTSCVIPHLYHVIQGARYERQAGPHFNLYTYDDIKTIADHRHYLGGNPHGGNGRSDLAGGGHAHAGAMIYLGGQWPEEYRGSLFMNNIHGARINRDVLEPKGSGFVGHHAPDFLLANDRWSQIISLKYGPDGSVYMIDWYDKNQCHNNELDAHDRTNGRIFKVTYGTPKPAAADLNALTSAELVKRALTSPNAWQARHAQRILQERGPIKDRALMDEFGEEIQWRSAIFSSPRRPWKPADGPRMLRALWARHVTYGSRDATAAKFALVSPSPYVRAWSVQLSCEDRDPDLKLVDDFVTLAADKDEPPFVRLYLASAVQRLPAGYNDAKWRILEKLVAHAEDANDPNLPLMYWYAAEPLAEVDASRALKLASEAKVPTMLPFMARRIAAPGTPKGLALLVAALGDADSPAVERTLLLGLNEALKGRRQFAMPKNWPKVGTKLAKSADAEVRSRAEALGLTFGGPASLKAQRVALTDAKADVARRREALEALLKVHDPELAATLQTLLEDPALRGQAIRGLAAYDDSKTPGAILAAYPRLTLDERRDALNTLAARVDYARQLLKAVESGQILAKLLTADIIRQLRNHKDSALDEQIGKVWGTVRETTADRSKLIAQYKALITSPPKEKPDPMLGRAVFVKTCQQCHTLFSVGGNVGPDLTGSNRADLDYLLANVLDPSALIGKDYTAHIVVTTNGRVLTGIIRSEDRDSLTIVSANEIVTLPKDEIEERRASEQSIMPDDVWKPLSEHEVRSLVAYLGGSAQVPMLATAENAPGLFNGRDLAGWEGNHNLWRVDNGEIVGKTKGLAHNDFLRSELVADDFRLRLQIKLVGDQGNSGIQFRSEALAGGEMRGYQADAGPGWWGKLYEENGRGLLSPKSGEAYVKPGQWNTYEIVAVGGKIRTAINGQGCVDRDDPSGARRGIFAFQLHADGPTEVRFKDIRLEVNPKIENSVSALPAGSR